jgi:hypothetical protein
MSTRCLWCRDSGTIADENLPGFDSQSGLAPCWHCALNRPHRPAPGQADQAICNGEGLPLEAIVCRYCGAYYDPTQPWMDGPCPAANYPEE